MGWGSVHCSSGAVVTRGQSRPWQVTRAVRWALHGWDHGAGGGPTVSVKGHGERTAEHSGACGVCRGRRQQQARAGARPRRRRDPLCNANCPSECNHIKNPFFCVLARPRAAATGRDCNPIIHPLPCQPAQPAVGRAALVRARAPAPVPRSKGMVAPRRGAAGSHDTSNAPVRRRCWFPCSRDRGAGAQVHMN